MKKRNKTMILALSSVLLCACAQSIELQKHTFTIELGKDVYANPSLYIKNGEKFQSGQLKVIPATRGIAKKDNRFVTLGKEYLVVGEYDFEIRNGSQETPFRIKIKDTLPPTLVEHPDEISVPLNGTIDWDSVFHATDLSGVSYEAPSDLTAQTGEHEITVTISDRYGNKIEQPIKVIVNA